MARTPLLTQVEELVAQVAAEQDPGTTTRRQFLRRAGVAGALAGAGVLAPGGRWVGSASASAPPRVVVIGAGLAGLTAAYRLKQAGISATVHEAATRVGGRCWTVRGVFDQGQLAEHGGELIDQGHTEIRHLAQELGLQLDNLLASEPSGTEDRYFFDGRGYSFTQATNDLKAVWQQIHSDTVAAGYPTLYTSSTARGRELDQMSVAGWIDTYVPGGRNSNLGQLLDVAYNIEYGAETSAQSSLNMLYLLGFAGQGNLRIFGTSNEKYRVRGGNDQIPELLAAALGSQVKLSSQLVAVRQNADTTYTLALKQGAKTVSAVADHVILALPFTLLRSVDYSKAGFSTVKSDAIRTLGMGTNSKLQLQFTSRVWNALGSNGATYSDTGYQSSWDVSRGQAGTNGILVDYTGGTIGASFGSGTLAARARQFLSQIEPVLPGVTAAWNGKASLDYWQAYPWTKGSYSYWKVGQYTTIAGAEGERSGNCHFAGEHTSIDSQGYLNGGVESGERAADEILADLKK